MRKSDDGWPLSQLGPEVPVRVATRLAIDFRLCLGLLMGVVRRRFARGHGMGGSVQEGPGLVLVLSGLQAVVQHPHAAVGHVARGGTVAVAAFASGGEVGVRAG